MKSSLENYLKQHNISTYDLKAVIFDMDGVLYDSMPAHDVSWRETMDELEMAYHPNEFYLQEGRVGKWTIDLIFQRNLGRDATAEEEESIYARKSELFQQYNKRGVMPGAPETLAYVQEKGLKPVLVTGSGQPSLLNRLENHFPGAFTPDTMVTAFDVKYGKPNPEPFVMGLKRGGDLQPNQAIVIENAPLGVEAAVGAGIFTIAVNTGPLPDTVLTDAGAAVIFKSMHQLLDELPNILALMKEIRV